ncbi:hypothetical protein T265_04442 [Opisthorchis viverrini]|uniref:Bromo domain-containing protein n=1 Tax=Opisthorchis viverrini TaxID=6198 RepID=A0A074ZSE9_OPIVI|nr:hypothetical protein T265_04442 [Opisthorchis viverrini]KER28747.1 hypothetical protein T265_04442 [Opisthorchis viverrini]
MEVHGQLVRRDPRGIFANPVTDEIAAGYSQTISHPMDLGTIYTRLQSRAYYRSATDYLADVTLMCDNAMVYNAPNTVYFERARKLLLFCRKLLMAPSLRKLCVQLGLKDELTTAEMGESSLSGELPQHHGKLNSICCRRLSGQDGGGALRSSRHGLASPKRDWYLVQSSSSQPSSTHSRLTIISRGGSSRSRGSHRRHHLGSSHSRPFVHKENPKNQTDHCSSNTSLLSSDGSTLDDSFSPSKTPPVHVTPSTETPGPSPRRPRGRPRKTPRVVPTTSADVQPQIPPCSSTVSPNISSPDQSFSRVTRRASFSPNSTHTDSSQVGLDDSITESTNLTPSSTPITFETTSISATPFPPGQPLTSQCESTPASSSMSPVIPAQASPILSRIRSSSELGSSSVGRKRKRSVELTYSLKLETTKKRNELSRPYPLKSDNISMERPRSPRRKRGAKDTEDDTDSITDSKASSPASVNPSEPTPVKTRKSSIVQTEEPEDEILLQARQAAALAADRLRSRYATPCGPSRDQHHESATRFGPRIVYLNHDKPGEITATDCPKAQSRDTALGESKQLEVIDHPSVFKVNYPSAFVRSMTGELSDTRDSKTNSGPTKTLDDIRNKVAANPLVEPLSVEEQDVLKQLDKLKYGPDEPLSAAIHGPLAIFSSAEMGRFSDVYGCDLTAIEYAYSLLRFVEPMGRWARRWAAKKLDAATDGMHSQLAYYCQSSAPTADALATADDDNPKDPENDPSCPPATSWMQSVNLTAMLSHVEFVSHIPISLVSPEVTAWSHSARFSPHCTISDLSYCAVEAPILISPFPLVAFSASSAEMGRFSDVYGCDLTAIEYAYSLLRFVEPMGRWARRWAAKKLDAATDGMHSQLAYYCQSSAPIADALATADDDNPKDPENDPSCPPATSWMQSVNLTLDSPTPPSSPEPMSFLAALDEKPDPSLLQLEVDPEHTPMFNGLGDTQLSQTPFVYQVHAPPSGELTATTTASSDRCTQQPDAQASQFGELKADSTRKTSSHSTPCLLTTESPLAQAEPIFVHSSTATSTPYDPSSANSETSSSNAPTPASRIMKQETHEAGDKSRIDPSQHTSVLKAVLSVPVSELNLLADRVNHHTVSVSSSVGGAPYTAFPQTGDHIASASPQTLISQTCSQTPLPHVPVSDTKVKQSAQSTMPLASSADCCSTEKNVVTPEPTASETEPLGTAEDVCLDDILGDAFGISTDVSPPTKTDEQIRSVEQSDAGLDMLGSVDETKDTGLEPDEVGFHHDSSDTQYDSQRAQPVGPNGALSASDNNCVRSLISDEPKISLPESPSLNANRENTRFDEITVGESVSGANTPPVEQLTDANEQRKSADECCVHSMQSSSLELRTESSPGVDGTVNASPIGLPNTFETEQLARTDGIRCEVDSAQTTARTSDENGTLSPQSYALETAETEDQFIHNILYGVYTETPNASQTELPLQTDELSRLDDECLVRPPVFCTTDATEPQYTSKPNTPNLDSGNATGIDQLASELVGSHTDQSQETAEKLQSADVSPSSPVCSNTALSLSNIENLGENEATNRMVPQSGTLETKSERGPNA